MNDIDEHIGHRYVPGHEREHCDWVCDFLRITMEYWEAISMVGGGFLLIGMIFGIRRLMQAISAENVVVRPRTDEEKRDHLRTMRELRQSK